MYRYYRAVKYHRYAVACSVGIVRLEWVDRISAFLVHNLGFFFVPAGVGLMKCLGLLADQWIPIVGASVGSTVVIIAVTGWVHQLVRRSMSRRQRRSVGIGVWNFSLINIF